DLEQQQCIVVRRDTGQKKPIKLHEVKQEIKAMLTQMQNEMYQKAKEQLEKAILPVTSWDAFIAGIEQKKLIKAPFCLQPSCEEAIKAKTQGVSSRNIPLTNEPLLAEQCVHCKEKSKANVYFSKAY
ncbi:MAG: hypothetical protein QW594_03215, partial [Candidatus Woesearchaeota archaeon]